MSDQRFGTVGFAKMFGTQEGAAEGGAPKCIRCPQRVTRYSARDGRWYNLCEQCYADQLDRADEVKTRRQDAARGTAPDRENPPWSESRPPNEQERATGLRGLKGARAALREALEAVDRAERELVAS